MSNEESAKMFVEAIRKFANNPDGLDNLESYLSRHFNVWLEKYANNPENIAGEMKCFSEINEA